MHTGYFRILLKPQTQLFRAKPQIDRRSRIMRLGEIYNMCKPSFFRGRQGYEQLFFAAILKCIDRNSTELHLIEKDGYIDVLYVESQEYAHFVSIPVDLSKDFCDFAARAFPHKEVTSFIKDINSYSIVNINGVLVHVFFCDCTPGEQFAGLHYCFYLMFDGSSAPQEAAKLANRCRKAGLFG